VYALPPSLPSSPPRWSGHHILASPCHAEERRPQSGRSDPERRRRASRLFAGTARRGGASIRPGHRTRINTGCAHGFLSVPVRVIRVQPLALSVQNFILAGFASPPSAARSEGQVGQREGKPHAPGTGATFPPRAKKRRTPAQGVVPAVLFAFSGHGSAGGPYPCRPTGLSRRRRGPYGTDGSSLLLGEDAGSTHGYEDLSSLALPFPGLCYTPVQPFSICPEPSVPYPVEPCHPVCL